MDITLNNSGISYYRTAITDVLALLFVGLVPAASHMLNFPVYFIEPMRIMLIVALLYSSRFNAFALAIMLPMFSFLISGHPFPLKMVIIMAELLLNAWLFLLLFQKTKMPFLSTFSSILISKIFCYATYLVVFSWAFVMAEAAPLFLLAQVVLTLLLSGMVWFMIKGRNRKTAEV